MACGPPLVGGLTELTGLRIALLVPAAVALLAALFARRPVK